MGKRERATLGVVGVTGLEIEPARVERHAQSPAVQVIGCLRDDAVGVGQRDGLAFGIVGVSCGEIEARRVERAGEYAVDGIVAVARLDA